MHFKQFIMKWYGLIIVAILCPHSLCPHSLWLTLNQQLQLYIHPRYIIFSAVMALFGMLFVLLSTRQNDSVPRDLLSWRKVAGMVVLLCLAFAVFIVIKPAILGSSTVTQRGVNTNTAVLTNSDTSSLLFGNNDYSNLSIKDWSSLRAQLSDPAYYRDKKVNVSGFVSASKNDSPDIFYVSRFVVTCCAVDASPVGVPVYKPNWKTVFAEDEWVHVEGSYIDNPANDRTEKSVVKPLTLQKISQPKDPYVY